MLVLSRRIGQSVVLNGNITVTVLAVNGSQIKLGIEAPKEIPVVRPDAKNKQPKGEAA